MIDPKALVAALGRVLAQISALLDDGDVIAIDGSEPGPWPQVGPRKPGERCAARATRARTGGTERADPHDVDGLCRAPAPDTGHGGRRRWRRTWGGA